MECSTGFVIYAWIVIGWQAFLLLMALFEPALRYQIKEFDAPPIDSEAFMRILEALTDAQINHRSKLTVHTNGEQFYEAELQAIGQARKSITLEAYIFHKGEVTKRFTAALAEQARAGVKVKVTLDAIGSFSTHMRYFKDLIEAGGNVEFYHPFNWRSVARINNRSHRELLIVDGKIGFMGGAGFTDHWLHSRKSSRRWRDTIIEVEGDVVCNLQATFAENWLESSGELIFGEEYFPFCASQAQSNAMVINSAPSVGGSTRARLLFQALVSAAKKTIYITTPYFLPDSSLLNELIRAVQRGVTVKVIVPGKKSDHGLTRSSSRRLYGSLLKAGAQIYEYQPSMIHAKVLILDGLWSVTGSTNFDNRSFGLNDEVNLAACDPEFAARLIHDFTNDLAESEQIMLESWQQRSVFERLNEILGWVLQRQQ